MLLTIFLTAIILLGLDSIYLFFFKDYFLSQIKSVQNSPVSIRIGSMIACYIVLIIGIYYFIIRQKRTILEAFLLGIVIYGVYETTNYATLRHWKLQTVFIDTAWGGILFASTAFLVYTFSRLFLHRVK